VYRYLTDLEVQIAYPVFNHTSNGNPTSVILVGEKINKTNFSIAELKFIKECTRLGDLLMQNYSLLVSDIQKKRVEKNLELAQLQLIPQKTVSGNFIFEDMEIGYSSLAALGVSGDYLDFFTDDANRTITIFLGDVSGHGIGSGYMVSSVKGLVSELMNRQYPLDKIFKFVNEMLLTKFPGNLFMSLIGGVYDAKNSSFEFINAGHLHPLSIHEDKTLQYIQTPDRVLGVLPTSFTMKKIFLEDGDRLIFFTDGVTETFNPKEEIFGIKRLEKCILEKLNRSTKELIAYIIQTLAHFREGSDLSDDLTFLCLKKLK
ncbi:MAG: serine/threonine-protein phosphatase, partial [Leptospiraceae bacterium]|nr:serine/threonine-protein phosphatase [Leptospiraceae bacterium]